MDEVSQVPGANGQDEPQVEGSPAEPENRSGKGRRKPAARKPAGRKRSLEQEVVRARLTPQERLLVLDSWLRAELPAKEYGVLVGVSPHTLYAWRRRFETDGLAGLSDAPKTRARGSRLDAVTRRAILLMKQDHPDWGATRIHHMLERVEGYAASPNAVLRVLREAGYEVEVTEGRAHGETPKTFERARPNQLWQSDLFTFLLKRDNRRVYLVVFLDDHSRFVTGYGVHASSSGALVREALEAAIANHGAPEEVLTDRGAQYHTWRGKSAFTRLLERRGIRHLLARPRHPQTLGKTERFWGTLWRECVEKAVFVSLEDARRRIGHFVDHYNFQRPHQGIEGLVPADRFFAAAPEVKATLAARVAANAAQLARDGMPRQTVYLTGRVGGESISLHGEGDRVVLTTGEGRREEVDLAAPGRRALPGEKPALPEPVAGQDPAPPEAASGEEAS